MNWVEIIGYVLWGWFAICLVLGGVSLYQLWKTGEL